MSNISLQNVNVFYPSPAVKTRPLGAEKPLADFPGLNSGVCSRVFDGETQVLKNVHLEFKNHNTTAVVGPSGSGKSTLLQLINGLVKPNSGLVTVFGKAINYNQLPALRKQIGYAVQGTWLFPHMTIRENITLLAKLEQWSAEKIEKRLNELVDLVELWPHLLDRYPYQLSGGQQQRVGLCRAMMLNPEILLLDETFGALDPITKHEIHEEFLRVQRVTDRTVLLVTHDVQEAMKLAKRLIVLHEGKILQHDDVEVVLKKPANAFVEQLLSSQLERVSL
ncbi:MAG: ABC transporter ATP-binding protein [Deltaproteobacteria bacterium CG_4_10_14_0_2_um_filter_43_8]|nr:MAG: ABC transporter ATP-binding protein [Deltaproteobacteria bacterium CG11_big_fil_rev_8_21_14_0_20_42_23]PJA21185.1 MAG: ABC transporter ATP-binding protein [Deltaproteobacteria bacterium CG_4_10_14_0_2_um_filter_43_8]PJC64795.1 MAG: ABC transporter ATP-binding protein [Deltaproteobacteria bacterium CG_4_9_14_0_2_um_filter_42_21]